MIVKKVLPALFPLFLLCTGLSSVAQDNHFVYLQSDNGEPFYVRLDGKLYSSTASGYIILPKLKSSDYEVRIGFPKDAFPEETFLISVNGENEGYLLTNKAGKWVLENYQTRKQVTGISDEEPVQKEATTREPIETDVFSSMLAEVIKDSSILKIHHGTASEDSAKKEEITVRQSFEKSLTPSEDPAKRIWPLPAGDTSATIAGNIQDSAQPTEDPVVRSLMVNTTGGQEMVYIDRQHDDTIRLLMPVSTVIPAPVQKARIIYQPREKTDSDLTITPAVAASTPKSASVKPKTKTNPDTTQIQARIIYKDEPVATGINKEESGNLAGEPAGNPGCTDIAGEKDFLRLRKRMAGERDKYRMIELARRSFRIKCYSTEQIRNLSFLFLDDEGRYQFLDAAYPYIYDKDMFYTLESLLTDSYYINRFKAMLHK